ncbi:MAG: heavy metal translocating P-type ATPase [Thermodesulfobacteriota bacterium]|nr:heavy metal translocating P-type ATPase [Thermodesulfobacteriota bacterium]
MPITQYAIKHRRPYRTRIRFRYLKWREKLCAAARKKLLELPGVTNVQVRVRSGSVILDHPDGQVALASILDLVFGAAAEVNLASSHRGVRSKKKFLCRICSGNDDIRNKARKNHISGPVLFFSGLYILYLFGKRLFTTAAVSTSLAVRLFSLPALVAYGLSLPIQRHAILNLKRTGKPDMGFISTGLLYVSILTGNVLAALSVFWLFNLSSWLEDRIKTRTRQAVREMLTGKVHTAWLVKDAAEIEVEVCSLQPGDIISLRLGNTIPVDGTVVTGKALVNEATMTGEGVPVVREVGHTVLAGTVIEEGEILVRVDKAGEATRLAAIIRLIESAESEPGELQSLSRQLSQAMVPVSLTLAGVAFLLTGNLLQAMAVLIITCPCALRLSTSVAISSAMSNAASQGILIKGGRYIETAGCVNVLVLDKTGTLTDMASEVVDVISIDNQFKPDTILQLAASAQKTWSHPLSRAITDRAEKKGLQLLSCDHSEFVVGQGIQARVNSISILVGSHRFMEDNNISFSRKGLQDDRESVSGTSRLYVARGGHLIGLIDAKHKIRGDAGAALGELRSMGVKHIVLLTGDHESGTHSLKEMFDFDEVCWEQSPGDKAAWIKEWKNNHPDNVVAMVGDGINDTPAFSVADLSLAIGEGGADVTVEYSDIVLQCGGIDQVAATLALGRKTLAVIKESYALAIGLNAATLAMTTLGLLSPVSGALLHNLITVAAVSNAATLRN